MTKFYLFCIVLLFAWGTDKTKDGRSTTGGKIYEVVGVVLEVSYGEFFDLTVVKFFDSVI